MFERHTTILQAQMRSFWMSIALSTVRVLINWEVSEDACKNLHKHSVHYHKTRSWLNSGPHGINRTKKIDFKRPICARVDAIKGFREAAPECQRLDCSMNWNKNNSCWMSSTNQLFIEINSMSVKASIILLLNGN